MTDLANLVLKRGQLKAQITRFQTFLDGSDNDITKVIEIETRLSRLGDILERFEELQCGIEILSGTEVQEEERQMFENSYYRAVSLAKNVLRPQGQMPSTHANQLLEQATRSQTSGSSITDNLIGLNIQGQVKLPNIALPDFYGHFNQWMTFHDTFNTLINNNQQLSNIQKFYYLQACLEGEAAQVIESIEMSNNNYEIAWALLKERYENKRLIINTHMRAIFDLQPVKFESFVLLRKLLDHFNKNFRALTAGGQPTEAWDTPMICTLTAKLDSVSKKEWEQQIGKDKDECITIKHFTDFLTQRCQLLEIIDNKGKRGTTVSNYRENKTLLSHVTTRDVNCSFCKQNHLNQNCEQLQKMPIKDRLIEVKKSKLCINCLRPGHFVKECRSPNCKLCHKKHHSLLHRINESSELDTREIKVNLACDAERENDWDSNDVETKSMTSTASTYENSKSGEHTQIILPTVIVRICDSQGNDIECRALLDSGSQSNFMSIALQKKLCLNATNVNIPIAGISNQRNSISKKTETVISSLDNKYKIKDTFLILREITNNLPQLSFDLSKLNLPEHIILADKQFNESKPIDLLLGASIFFDVLLTQQIKLGKNKPILQETMFGWIVSGRVDVLTRRTLTCNFSITGDNLHEQVERFWTTEEINTKRTYTRNELDCEKHFLETFRRDNEGRFELSLPLKGNVTDLGDSLDTAVHRFHLLEKQFERNQNLKDEYVKFMEEYKSLNHMTEIDLTKDDTNVKKYYLPHHGVIKETSTTTKLRVVFDASCKTTSSLSLNDILRVGPTIQRDLFSVALKFRKHNVVFTSDIEKMYRQCNVQEDQRDLQRIVWRSNKNEELKHFRMNTLTYGTAPASYLACRALHQVAIENERVFPEASNIIRNDFYMGDLISGAENIENAIRLKDEVSHILKSAGFMLRKWCSNSNQLLENNMGNLPQYYIAGNEGIKTLGLIWDPSEDVLSFRVSLVECRCVTKRFVLSVIAKIFDPLGLIGPITVQAKLLLQRLWQAQISWDEVIPVDVQPLWRQFYETLQHVNEIKIPRKVLTSIVTDIELHAFGDASESAYGACLYVRSTDSDGLHVVRLLCAKSKIAPLKKITLPRLELNAAVLLARLADRSVKALEVPFTRKYFWCDSSIVLNWIAAEPITWNTYVANRVTEIQELSKMVEWRHVPSLQYLGITN